MREFSSCLPWKRLDLWVSRILHDWCNPDAIRYQLLLVSVVLEPCHTDISAGPGLMNAEARVCDMSLGFCGKCWHYSVVLLVSPEEISGILRIRKFMHLKTLKNYRENAGISEP